MVEIAKATYKEGTGHDWSEEKNCGNCARRFCGGCDRLDENGDCMDWRKIDASQEG